MFLLAKICGASLQLCDEEITLHKQSVSLSNVLRFLQPQNYTAVECTVCCIAGLMLCACEVF